MNSEHNVHPLPPGEGWGEGNDDSGMEKLDSLLKEATEPDVPAGYWEELSQSIFRRTRKLRVAGSRGRAPRIPAFFQWSAVAAAVFLLAVALNQIVVLRGKVAEITQVRTLTTQGSSDASAAGVLRRVGPADTSRQITAALAIDEFLGGRTKVLATDGGETQIQTDGLWCAVREQPISVSFAVFKKIDDKMILVSSPTIAILRGNGINLRFRAQNEPISVEYECSDIAETPQGLLFPCRVSIVSAAGYRCQLSSSPYLRGCSVTKIGSVAAGNEQFEVFVSLQADAQKAVDTKI